MSRTRKTRPAASKRKVAPAKRARKSAARKRTAKPRTAPVPRQPSRNERPSTQDEAAFVEALIESGQAARVDDEGKLPPGATHRIVEDEAGNVKVVRRRFSIA